MKAQHSYFPLIIIGALAAATYWLEFVVSNESAGRSSRAGHTPDAIVHNLTMDRFDPLGRHQLHLTAEKMVHYGDDDTAELTQPRLVFNKNERTLNMRSNTGHGDNINREITLDGQVVGLRTGGKDFTEQRLATESLTVLTDDEFAFTLQPIVLTQGKTRIEAIGMEWDNAQGRLKLGPGQAELAGRSKN